MSDLQPLNDDERAELIAYLDGELNEDAARSVEARINRDPNVRAEADSLRRAWNLLDYLPKPEPSPDFTRQTVTRAAVIPRTLLGRMRRLRSWALGVGWVAALVVAGVVGYASVPLLHPKPAEPKPEEADQELVRDLRLIDQLPAYQDAGDISFLNELDRPELFADDQPGQK